MKSTIGEFMSRLIKASLTDEETRILDTIFSIFFSYLERRETVIAIADKLGYDTEEQE
jgi:hypothetical protein